MVGRRQERGDRTRRQILEAAALAFADGGYATTSVNAIVAASGVTKGAFYHHFDSKEELALACFGYKQEQLLVRLGAAVAVAPDAVAALRAAFQERGAALREDASLRAVLRLGAEFRAQPVPDPGFVAFQQRPFEALVTVVRRGQAEGTIRPELDPDETAEVVFGAVMGVDDVSHYLGGDGVQRRSEALLTLLIDGLASGKRRRTSRGGKRP